MLQDCVNPWGELCRDEAHETLTGRVSRQQCRALAPKEIARRSGRQQLLPRTPRTLSAA